MEDFHARQGAFLPHWRLKGAVYHAVFCLYDSIPRKVIEDLKFERDEILKNPHSSEAQKRQANLTLSSKITKYMDRGDGECWLKQPEVAELVSCALKFFDGARYDLHAWCVMPNHVHVVVQPASGWDLSDILHSWKSYTAHEANNLLGKSGAFWHKESYDHIIRNVRAYHAVIRYVLDNPETAGLDPSWPWRGTQ